MSHTASYTYDGVGRLANASASVAGSGTLSYDLPFSYDEYGNMTCVTNGNTFGGPCPAMSYNSNNQLTAIGGTGVTYDAAGNETGVMDGSGSGWYEQWVRAEGRLAVEYMGCCSWTRYLHANALGSTEATTDQTGAEAADILLYPWGATWEEAGDPHYMEHFAGMNQEDGVNWLYPEQFRRYTMNYGRWMTPDPLGGDVTNPQSLNRYAYALNNPTTFIDPLGLSCNNGSTDANGNFVISCTSSAAGAAPPPSAISIPLNACGEPEDFPTYVMYGDGAPCLNYNPNPGVVITGPTGPAGPSGGGGGAAASTPSSMPPQTQAPPKKPCTPLANNLQGTPAAGVDTLFDAFNRVTHPLDMLAVNATMFLAAGGQVVAGGLAIGGACLEPTPFEPLTCLAGGAAGTASVASGVASGAFGVYFFKDYTLPAIKDWGCHE